MGCKCKKDINISSADIRIKQNVTQADINLKKNVINITITREPDTPLISELRRQIEELQQLGLEFQDIDRKIQDAMSGLDIATKAYLAEVLTEYVKDSDLNNLKLELKEWADTRFLRKMYLSQEAYDALQPEDLNENIIYVII